MKAIIIVFFILFSFVLHAQKQTTYYANGKKKSVVKVKKNKTKKTTYFTSGKKSSVVYYDKDGTLISMKRWNNQGKLIISENFFEDRLEKCRRDLSFIEWNRKDSVSIYYEFIDSLDNPVGLSLKRGDSIFFHYICLDSAGYEYDNSYDRNTPLYMVIGTFYFLKSFSDAFLEMKVGEKAYILIPPEYGYGNKPAGNVPPNTTLVYYVEILRFNKGVTEKRE